MRVLHITNNYPTEENPAFGIFVKEQIDSLERIGIDNQIFFINGKAKGKIEYVRSYFKLITLLISKKFDVIHCHHALSAIIFLLTGFAFFNKCIVSYQNQPSRECGIITFKIIRLFFDKLIVKNTLEFDHDSKVVYLPNGVNTEIFKPIDRSACTEKLNLESKKKYILFFDSNYGKRTQKRYDIFLKVIEILKERGHNDLTPLVLTNAPRTLIPFYINVADLYILCSDFEGSPNSVKECMACNIKVVSTNVGNVKEMTESAEGYFIASTHNSEEIASLSEKALNEISVSGRDNIFKKGLDIESVALDLETLYKSL